MSYEHRDTEHIEILSDKDATVAYIRLGAIEVTGSARRTPGDKPDRETGELLALARAYAKLAAKLEKRANGRVNHAAEIKRHKEERKIEASYEAARGSYDDLFPYRRLASLSLLSRE